MTYLEKILKDKDLAKKIMTIFSRLSMHVDGSWRNVDNRILEVVNERYKEKEYLNTYGEIYIIEKRLGFDGQDKLYVCRRLRFDMQTTKELYLIREIDEVDADGEYLGTEYEIELYKEELC